MSGLIAIKGFDYQATVILDRVFKHFDTHGDTARVHPESKDDLDLTWDEPDGSAHSRFVQIKKQREDENGNRKPRAWSVQEVIDEILANTIRHLTGNSSEQIWIFGDEIEADLKALIAAGIDAPTATPAAYFKMVHVLARNHALAKLDQTTRASIIRWNIPDALLADLSLAFATVINAYARIIETKASADVATLYRNEAQSVHDVLPDVLSRTKIECLYGSEEAVAQRVCDTLVARFELDPSVVKHAMFRNLRGFINDVSKQSGRSFDRVEFDLEMRSIWPQMLLVKEPPPLPGDHLARSGITDLLTKNWTGRTVEVLGVSGSGKTTLASETIVRSQASDPQRLALYIEITKTARLRDALAGVGFHLRHSGFPSLFAIAVDQRGSNEEVLKNLGRAFAVISQSLLLVFDLVEGTCNDAFARDLATFVRNLLSTDCHLVVVGQEDAMRGLNALDRKLNGVSQLDLHGFNFEEFFKLASPKHADASREQLSEIYEKVTAGKAARLLPLLAKSLVAAPSYTAMAQIAAQPAEDRLEYAEREKFARISIGARGGAERIICFALAFSRVDAEDCFPSENIGMAIRELTELGLLRTNADQTFEMHETVRAGLEGLLSLETRRSAHFALAAHCQKNGLLAAEIFHLEKAGDLALAKTRARVAVLGGLEWSGLAAWITKHQVITDAELLAVAASDEPFDALYLLPDLLLQLGRAVDLDQITRLLRNQANRVIKQYQWGAAMFAAALAVAPKALTDLVAFALQNYTDARDLEHALGMLLFAARRAGASTNPSILSFFNSADVEKKQALLPLMLFENRRENLSAAFDFISVADLANERSRAAWQSPTLQIETAADVIEILGAVPEVEPHVMLGSKSTLLGALAPLIWQKRRLLQIFCAEILRSAKADSRVLKNAIRILTFVMDPCIVAICDKLVADGPEALRAYATLMPSLVPTLVDQHAYRSRVLDIALPISVRHSSLFVLTAVGADMSSLYDDVKGVETSAGTQGWDFFFLLLSAQTPFPEALELLRSQLSAANGMPPDLLLGALRTLGALPIADAASLLQNLLSHENRDIRLTAAQVLGGRRSRSARLPLVAQFLRETDTAVAVQLAVSTVASEPDGAVSFAHPRIIEPALQLWQCILSNRLGNANDAQCLIDVATNATLHWQLRRTAISAAGKLPFATAMERILPVVMAERSSLAIDQHNALTCHSALSWLLANEAGTITTILNRGKQEFAAFWAECIGSLMAGDLWPDGMPTATAAAEWLYDRLRHHGSPTNGSAPDIILNEIHVPLLQSAALRSLRQTGRADLIENELAQASSLWLALKCLLQRRMGESDTGLLDRLRGLIATSRFKDELILQRVLESEFGGEPITNTQTSDPTAEADPEQPMMRTELTYEDARRMLESEAECALPDPSTPRILDSVSQEQFERLVLLADPVNDRYKTTETYVPQMSFSRDGYSVARRQSTYTAASEPAGSILRPVIAAANSSGVDIHWHEQSLNGPLAGSYISRLVASLNAQDSSKRFYEEVLAYPDLLLPELSKAAMPLNCRHIDGRIVSTLVTYANSGTDEFFETLCTIASLVQSSEIDPALAALFARWVRAFNLRALAPQNVGNYRLWRGFNKLHTHPRFERISGWQQSVADVIRCSLSWYHKQDLARILERHPSSYTQIETILFREEDWQHFARDEISRLEEAADHLFRATTD